MFRIGVLAATLVSAGIAGAGTGFAAPNSGSALPRQPQPPLITLMPHGLIHVDAPEDGSYWFCKGMSVAPPVYLTAGVRKGPAPSTGSAAGPVTAETADLQFPPDVLVLWECDSAGPGNTTYKSEGPLQTLP